MNLKKGFITALSLSLMLLSGCQSAPAPTAPPEPIIDSESVSFRFNDFTYERPDLDAINALLDQGLALCAQTGKEQELLALYDEIMAKCKELEVMDTLASIKSDMDLSDEYYEGEVNTLDNFYTKFDNRMNTLTGEILASEYKDAFTERWGEEFIKRYEINSKLNSPAIEALSEKETELIQQYSKALVADYTTEYKDKTVGLNDLDFTDSNVSEPYYAIYEQKNKVLGELYRELIQVRMEIAHTLGYESYTDYAYDLLGRDFTKEDAAAFADKVKASLSKLYAAIDDQYYYDISDAKADITVMIEDSIPYLYERLQAEFPKEMQEALNFMLASDTYILDNQPSMMQAGYSTILNGYGPYMFINTSAYRDASTLFHEFGHYNNFYLMHESIWNDSNNLDLAEVHSQGLEVLMMESYEEMYGKNAELMKIDLLQNLVNSVLQGCVEDEFQQRVYENPDMTLDEINQLHGDLYEQYFGYPVYYEWIEIHHHFETPFYYISYATSAISALEIWRDAVIDRSKALDTYQKLSHFTLNVDYLDALSQAGMSNPFSSDIVDEIADTLAKEIKLK